MSHVHKAPLSTGKVVANLCRPVNMMFQDGTILKGCSPKRARELDVVVGKEKYLEPRTGSIAIIQVVRLSCAFKRVLESLETKHKDVDYFLVTKQVMMAMVRERIRHPRVYVPVKLENGNYSVEEFYKKVASFQLLDFHQEHHPEDAEFVKMEIHSTAEVELQKSVTPVKIM